ncbi:LacI family DNA-binding transcriptional regulator [Corynebacterium pelargi]|uniref:HTH-type transcriptional regulator GntR n=1 Tax=Corynebacterium pelargi TaxID=1471400 RepID=A0A410W6L1_9CORY|nr:LacI family DNA-binding transcriptional regulator [Corynebacterium pelargi]QAU51668.1 HTH-type transcriptional regulator GntR [Corynebacterium pelargi]GGG80374.1 transcriptional regulator [Corynebacterium pelargi]
MAARKKKRLSLASVAEELGVSRTTVSNAYNHPEQLSEALRADIFATAERLGYPGPDPTARSLRTRVTGSMGVLFTDHLTYAFEDVASLDFMAGMAEVASQDSTSMTLVPVGPDYTEREEARSRVNQAVVDGFVVYSVAREDPFLEAVVARGLPTVVCDQPKDPRLPFVGIDDAEAIAPAAQALVEAGHRHIGILCIRLDPVANNGPVSAERLKRARHETQRNRVNGALEVFERAGIAREQVPVVERHINDMANNVDAARELLSTNPRLTAVLCTTDTMALGVLDYAASQGIRVPEDLSLTGFDGIAPALNRNLSTVLQPNREKGRAAATLLAKTIADPTLPRRTTLLATSFYTGGTIAPPAV